MASPRNYRFIWALVGVFLTGLVLYWLRGSILPFLVGGALAYILFPFVVRVERLMPWRESHRELSRVASIFLVLAIVLGIIAGALVAVIPPLVRDFQQLINSLPQILDTARETIVNLNRQISAMIPAEIRQQIEMSIQNLGANIGGALQNIIARTFSAVTGAFGIILGLAVVPLFLYYVLKDNDYIVDGLASWIPPRGRTHFRNVVRLINRVLSSYVRGQLLLGLAVGALVFVSLFILDIEFAALLAIIAGFTELIPIIGPWLGAIPGVIVALATSPEKVIWVILVYLGVQLLENSLLVPRIQSQVLNVHPIVIIVVIVVGSQIAGFWGILLGPPLVVTAKEVLAYFRDVWGWTEPEHPEAAEEPAPTETPDTAGEEVEVPESLAPESGRESNS